MCGICGFVYKEPSQPVDPSELIQMRDVMDYRGPDDAGSYIQPGIALGSRRLAILDLSARGHMPMSAAQGRYWIVYNGEIYNFRELRDELHGKGYGFDSNTDTEVILNGYIEEGPEFLDKLDGMFAFAIWDAKKRELFLARDHIGIKPLYYAENQKGLYFASEQKGLFAAGIPMEIDPHMWEELLCFGYVSGERTPFRNVKRLLAGHYLIWREGNSQIKRWWNLSERAREIRSRLPKDPVSWFKEAFDRSVRYRRISDVPVGILLSGGLDSSSVAASLALQSDSPVSSFTVRFTEKGYNESEIARGVAKKYNFRYYDFLLDPQALFSHISEASWINDEPLLHASTPHLLALSRFSKSKVTVLLSGEGSDEILGGYDRYHLLHHRALFAAKWLPNGLDSFSHRLKKLKRFSGLSETAQIILCNSSEIFPSELPAIGMIPQADLTFRRRVLAEAQNLYPHELSRQAMYYDQHTFLGSILDRNDRMTMGASIECRVPFLDSKIMEITAALPTSDLFAFGQGKRLLRKSLGHRLPQEVLRHKKWGFDVPWTRYLRMESLLRNYLIEIPHREPARTVMPIEPRRLQAIIVNFLKGDNRHEKLIRRFLMVSIWYETYKNKCNLVKAKADPFKDAQGVLQTSALS